MKKIILMVVLFLLAAGGGGAAYWQWQEAKKSAAALATAQEELAKLKAELEAYTKPGPDGQTPAAVMRQKAEQLDAAREALAGGMVLGEVEALDKAAKAPSAERKLGLGALRMLVKGPTDPSVAEAFEEALKIMDIESRLSATCAAQAGMRAAGKQVQMMSECANRPAAPAPSAAQAEAPAAGSPAPANPAPATPGPAQRP
jgi:sugar phosphate isomerase/epimerase